MRKTCFIAIALTAVALLAAGCGNNKTPTESNTSSATEFATLDSSVARKVSAENPIQETTETVSGDKDCPQPETTITFTVNGIEVCVPSYAYNQSVTVNNGIPLFTADELTTTSFEHYSDLDSLGRCQTAMACLSRETQPAEGEQRGEIGKIKPTGWHTVKYDCIPDRFLWNRSHLVARCLGAENANEKNLVTGTRAMNLAMTDIEIPVSDYIRKTGNHVMYRATPVFEGSNLTCDGILIEAYSVEDNGTGISYCTFFYNEQPGVVILHATGESYAL